jgi:two-component system, sensor histidine kinase and response regulator
VEDNPVNRRVAQGLLSLRGHEVLVAENGRVALDVLATEEFDLVLMDMQMPEMDGYEATEKIRESERLTGGHLPIIAMTAEAMSGDAERCLATGMDDYISKPIDSKKLYAVVEKYPAVCLTHRG